MLIISVCACVYVCVHVSVYVHICLYVHVCFVCMCIWVSTMCVLGACGGQKRVSDSLELELDTVLSHHVMLAIELGTPAREATAIPPCLKNIYSST